MLLIYPISSNMKLNDKIKLFGSLCACVSFLIHFQIGSAGFLHDDHGEDFHSLLTSGSNTPLYSVYSKHLSQPYFYSPPSTTPFPTPKIHPHSVYTSNTRRNPVPVIQYVLLQSNDYVRNLPFLPDTESNKSNKNTKKNRKMKPMKEEGEGSETDSKEKDENEEKEQEISDETENSGEKITTTSTERKSPPRKNTKKINSSRLTSRSRSGASNRGNKPKTRKQNLTKLSSQSKPRNSGLRKSSKTSTTTSIVPKIIGNDDATSSTGESTQANVLNTSEPESEEFSPDSARPGESRSVANREETMGDLEEFSSPSLNNDNNNGVNNNNDANGVNNGNNGVNNGNNGVNSNNGADGVNNNNDANGVNNGNNGVNSNNGADGVNNNNNNGVSARGVNNNNNNGAINGVNNNNGAPNFRRNELPSRESLDEAIKILSRVANQISQLNTNSGPFVAQRDQQSQSGISNFGNNMFSNNNNNGVRNSLTNSQQYGAPITGMLREQNLNFNNGERNGNNIPSQYGAPQNTVFPNINTFQQSQREQPQVVRNSNREAYGPPKEQQSSSAQGTESSDTDTASTKNLPYTHALRNIRSESSNDQPSFEIIRTVSKIF